MESPRPESVKSQASSSKKHKRHSSHSKHRKHHHHHHHHADAPEESPIQRFLDVLAKLPVMATLTEKDLGRLAMHLYAVAFAIRPAHWIKEVHLGFDGAQQLAVVCSQFPMSRASVALIYEPLSGRVMAVNKHITQSRLLAQLDEGFDSPDQWFVQFDKQGNGRFVVAEQVPFFSKALKTLVRKLEAIADANDEVAVLEMEPDWISPIGCETQAVLRLMTVQHFLLAHPAIYVFDDDAAKSVGEGCQLLAHRRAWIGSVYLEGNRPEEDHLLIKSTFPEGLFSPDSMDLTDDTAQMSLAEVSDRIQTRLLERLDSGDLRKVWRDVTVTIEGPFSHQSAWQACGLRHWARTEKQYTRTPSSSSASEDLSTASDSFTTTTTPSDILSSDLERQLTFSPPLEL